MTHPPREWGPDDETGRWGNNMMALRNDTAERTIEMYRQVKRLRRLHQQGKATRAGTIRELNELVETSLRCIMNMQAAGAPIDVSALDCDD